MYHSSNEMEHRMAKISSKLEDLLKGRQADFANLAIDTDELRDFILALRRDAGSTPRCFIKNAVFEQQLDLSDGRMPDGSALPAIEFHCCTFHYGFCADGARLERLKFFCCKFVAKQNVTDVPWPEAERCEYPTDRGANLKSLRKPINCISLRHCRIETELRLESMRPTDWNGQPGVLTVDAFAVRIGTNVHISDTILRSQQGESSQISEEPHYALHLATASIGGDVQLMPNVVLEGGLKMRDAQVGGSFWAMGLCVTDGETPESRNSLSKLGYKPRMPFWLDTIAIQGNLAISSYEDRLFHSQGAVSLMNASIVGDLFLDGEIHDILILQGATVRGSLSARGDLWSFWGPQCREVISRDIGRWLIDQDHAPWPDSQPPPTES